MTCITYRPPAKTARAIVQTTGWLKAVKIPFSFAVEPGYDFSVQTRDGQTLRIHISPTDRESSPGLLRLRASELTDKDLAKALSAFHALTQAAGYGTPLPVNRGPAPEKKLMYKDDFDRVAMRHREFARVANPDPEELAQYRGVAKKATARFMKINEHLCQRHGFTFNEAMTFAQLWTCNFLGLYKVINPTQNDNERLLHNHLVQRFAELKDLLEKKGRSMLPSMDTVAVALTDRPWEPLAHSLPDHIREAEITFEDQLLADMEEEADGDDDDLEILEGFMVVEGPSDIAVASEPSADEEERDRKRADAKRRKAAQAQLAEALTKMPHDTMIETLERVMRTNAFCPDARDEARKQLRLHVKGCQLCLAAQMQKEHAGADARS